MLVTLINMKVLCRSEASKKMAQLKETKKKRTAKIDQHCYLASRAQAAVVDDYDCMLNQTNIGHNNNKYYVIQLINCLGSYYVWNRWGRVGESGQNAMKEAFGDLNKAVKEFEKKFKDKTKNDWSARHKFTPAPGKYTLIEMDDEDEDDGVSIVYHVVYNCFGSYGCYCQFYVYTVYHSMSV